MPRLLVVLALLAAISACAARQPKPAPAESGIVSLTLEQEREIGGISPGS